MKIRKVNELEKLIADQQAKIKNAEDTITKAKKDLKKIRQELENLKEEKKIAEEVEFSQKLSGADREYIESYLKMSDQQKATTRNWVNRSAQQYPAQNNTQ